MRTIQSAKGAQVTAVSMIGGAILAVLVCSLTACGGGGGDSDADSFVDRLTQGSWTKTVGTEPQQERYTYEFHDDGTYRRALFTDVTPPPQETGTWTVETDSEDRTHLLLHPEDETRECFFLACDSIAFFRDGNLVVTGEPYDGDQTLEHTPPLGDVLT